MKTQHKELVSIALLTAALLPQNSKALCVIQTEFQESINISDIGYPTLAIGHLDLFPSDTVYTLSYIIKEKEATDNLIDPFSENKMLWSVVAANSTDCGVE